MKQRQKGPPSFRKERSVSAGIKRLQSRKAEDRESLCHDQPKTSFRERGLSDNCRGRIVKNSPLLRCHVATSPSSTPFVFTARQAVILPPERPELRQRQHKLPAWCPVSSQHRRFRQPHLFGSGVSFTHTSSAAAFVDGGIGARHFQ